MLHAVVSAIAHGVEKGLALPFALFDVLAGAERRPKNFENGDAAFAIAARQEALREDKAEGFRKAIADAGLILHGERADDAFNGLGGVDGVERGEDKVTGFGGFESDFDGLAIAHFADQNDFGSLAQCG